MSTSMIVIDSDSLLVERKEGADCAIFLPLRVVPEHAEVQPVDEEPQDPDAEEQKEEVVPHTVAMTLYNSDKMLTPKQIADWLQHMKVSEVDIGLLPDICDDLLISKLTAVCLLSDNAGFVIHSVVRTTSGDWECVTKKGGIDKYAVITSDGVVNMNDRTHQADSPEKHAIVSYATYARYNDELSNNFDHYVAMIDEIIENARI